MNSERPSRAFVPIARCCGVPTGIALALALLLAAPSLVSAQALPEPAASLAVYDSRVDLDLAAASIYGHTVLHLRLAEARRDSLAFRLAPGITVTRVGGAGVTRFHSTPLEFRTEHVVHLDGTVPAGDVLALEIEFTGTPTWWESVINEISEDWVQLSMDSGWHPEPVGVGALVGELRIALPRHWTVIGSGSSTFEDGVHVLRNTLPLPDVPFSAGPDVTGVGTDRFTVFHVAEREGDVQRVLDAAGACEAYLNSNFGGEDPLPHLRFVLSARGRSTFFRTNYVPIGPLGEAPDVDVHRYLCHELAHYWSNPPGSPAEHWMSEAFAEYAAGMSLRQHFGREAFDRWRAARVEGGRSHGPIWTPDLTRRVPDPAIYDRAPGLLAELEEGIGEERFLRFIQAYMTERIATTERLLQRLAEIGGPDAADWLRSELMEVEDG